MKILVIGAGGLGGLLAGKLIAGGHDVTLLARGRRLEELQQKGLILHNWISGQVSVLHPKTIDLLSPQDEFDLAAVVMGKDKVSAVLPMLAAGSIPTVLFIGNNVAGADEFICALGRQRVLLGFLLAGGTVENGISYFAEGKTGQTARFVLGEPDGSLTPRLESIKRMLQSSQFDVTISCRMESWLKTHADVVVPLACGLFLVNGGLEELAATPDAVLTVIRGAREALKVQRKLGIPVEPPRIRVLDILPEPLLLAVLRRSLLQPEMKYAVAHAGGMRPELNRLAGEMAALAALAQVETPNLNRLFAAIDPSKPALTVGSNAVQPAWKELLPWICIPLLLAAVFSLKRRPIRK